METRYTIVYEEASDHVAGEEVSDDAVVWRGSGTEMWERSAVNTMSGRADIGEIRRREVTDVPVW